MAFYENWETGDVISADRLNAMGYVISVSVDHYTEDIDHLMVLDITYEELKDLMHDKRVVVLTDENDQQYIFVSAAQYGGGYRAYAITVTGGSIAVVPFSSATVDVALTEVGEE